MSGELAPVGGSDPAWLPTFADEGTTTAADVDPRLSLPRLHRVAQRRAAWLADRLAEAVAERGLVALVDDQYGVDAAGELVRTGEQIRSLAVLEAQERDRAERIAATMARLGLEAASRQDAVPTITAVAWLEAFAAEAGLAWDNAETRRMAQRAIIAVKRREVSPT